MTDLTPYRPAAIAPRLLDGRSAVVTLRELPMRRLNAKMWGDGSPDGGPVKLGGCGRICEGGSWVPVYDTGGRWSPGALATCDSKLLCDFCGPRAQAESRERWEWHFADWLAGGGQLLNLRLSFAHGRGDDLAPMLDDLRKGFEGLRKSSAWRDAGVVDWVRVLHLRWSHERGWYPHYHVTCFVRPGVTLDEERVTEALQGAWRDRVTRAVGRRVSRRHGLFARVVGETWRALYAWSWADPDDERRPEDERADTDRDHVAIDRDYRPDEDDDDTGDGERRSWALHHLAEAALDGDKVAWAAWGELCRALKGVPVVRCSKMLNDVWKVHAATIDTPEPVELGAPVAQVAAPLWERARRAGVTEMGLELGRTHGVEAMAQWWASRLGVTVLVGDEDCPRLWARAGPTLGRMPDPSLN